MQFRKPIVISFMLMILVSSVLAQDKWGSGFAFKQNAKLGRGVNIIGYDPIWRNADSARMKEVHFKLLKEAGFSNVRIVISPFKYATNDTTYILNPKFFVTLDWAVKMALKYKLMAIIDFHEHKAMQNNPIGTKPMLVAMWKQIANHYKDYSNEVLFEIANEPNMKPELWNDIYTAAYQVIRASNPKRTIVVGAINGNQIKFLKDLVLPEEDRNIIVAIHYYSPIQFTHQGASWSVKNKDLSGIEWRETDSATNAVKEDFKIAQDWSRKYNRPLTLGEFGAYEKADLSSRIRWTNYIARQAESNNWSWSYWQFDSNFILFDMNKQDWFEPIKNALIPHDNQLSKQEKKDGWKLLFDGKTSTGWKAAFSENFPEKGWEIKEGLLMVEPSNGAESSNGGDIVTRKTYNNFELTLDFKLTEGAYSGVKYFVSAQQPTPSTPRSAYGLEFQLLDDERHPDAKLGKNGNRTIASLYDLIPAISNKPVKQIGDWNSLKIVSNGSHVEHWLNGVMVLTYERGSSLFKTLVSESKYRDIPNFGLTNKGRILLQDHGNKVYFKNIKIRETKTQIDARENKLFQETPGIVSFTFRNSFQKNFAATLDSIKTLGFTNIEFSNLFGKKAIEIRKMLGERKMICTSYGVNYDDILNKTTEIAENAKTLGASFVRVAWIPHDKTTFTFENAKKAVEDFNAIGKKLKDEFGLTFCYHNHGYEMQPYENGTFFDYIVAHTNPDYVSFELDILWAFHPGKDPIELLHKYGPRFKLMHVKDLKKGVVGDLTGTTPVENDVALGSGQINIAAVILAAQKSGIKYFYIEDESKSVNIQVPISLALLKAL